VRVVGDSLPPGRRKKPRHFSLTPDADLYLRLLAELEGIDRSAMLCRLVLAEADKQINRLITHQELHRKAKQIRQQRAVTDPDTCEQQSGG